MNDHSSDGKSVHAIGSIESRRAVPVLAEIEFVFTGDAFLSQLADRCSTKTAVCNGGSVEGVDGDRFSRSNRIEDYEEDEDECEQDSHPSCPDWIARDHSMVRPKAKRKVALSAPMGCFPMQNPANRLAITRRGSSYLTGLYGPMLNSSILDF
jgi:hypothetical protein